jgi:hypothetical protein
MGRFRCRSLRQLRRRRKISPVPSTISATVEEDTIEELGREEDTLGSIGESSHLRTVLAAIVVASSIGYLSLILNEQQLPVNACTEARKCNTCQFILLGKFETLLVTTFQESRCSDFIREIDRPNRMNNL